MGSAPYWKIEMSCALLAPFVVLRSAMPRARLEIAAVALSLAVVARDPAAFRRAEDR